MLSWVCLTVIYTDYVFNLVQLKLHYFNAKSVLYEYFLDWLIIIIGISCENCCVTLMSIQFY